VVVANHCSDVLIADRREHAPSPRGMALGYLVFGLAQAARIVEDSRAGVELADVVHGCGRLDPRYLDRMEVHRTGDARGLAGDSLAVPVGVGVARFAAGG